MMADDQADLASKDVFVLLGVSAPENLNIGTSPEEEVDSNDESKISLDEVNNTYFMVMCLLYVIVFVIGGKVIKKMLMVTFLEA